MKIAFLSSEKLPVPPVQGGAVENWIYQVAKTLAQQRHYVLSLSIKAPEFSAKDYPDGVDYRFYKKGLLGKILLCTYKLPFKKEGSRFYFIPYSFWAAWQARRAKVQIIHILSRPQFAFMIKLLNPQAKIILHLQNRSVVEPGGKLFKKKLFDRMDRIICCSHSLKEEILSLYPYLQNKTVVIYNGIDTNTFQISKIPPEKVEKIRAQYNISREDKVLLFTGRLVEYKGVHILISAFRNLLEAFPNLKLLILGGVTYSQNQETPYIQELKKLSRSFEDRIIFTGYVAHEEIPNFIATCDIFVVPSLWAEPFGVVNIEAMAMGKPVVAFARGGIKEIITHRHDGILLEDATNKALAKALTELLDNPQLCQQLGQNARLTTENRFAWNHVVHALTQEYQHLTLRNSN
ncbi:MAG: glycosyltransferase family 4 protein [Candidatus Omnitrophica bacterium]|nr:glycosyltransferase family 4 protein [Candidatus Omnitrophota bacterium]